MSKKTLIIVESPTKARTLTRFLGNKYAIHASMGHIRDLPKKRLGVNIGKNFEPTYEVAKDKKGTVSKLKAAAKASSRIILAPDPDREGEAIAWHVAHVIKGKKKNMPENMDRIVFHEITKSAIEHALEHPKSIDMNLVDAQQGRRILDRLVGYKLSPLLWSKLGRNWLSAGRVQSIALRIIVEREREIEAFDPVEFWEIHASLNAPNKSQIQNSNDQQFLAKLVKIGDKKAEVKNKEEADRVVRDLERARYVVSEVKKTGLKRKPAPPFITSTLQRAASSYFGWSSKKSMMVAQRLYEDGKITYHRTDSVALSKEGVAMARGHIEKIFGKDYLPEEARVFKTKSKVAQEAHEAIRPTVMESANTGDEGKLWSLIMNRFLASQMKDQEVERTTIVIAANPQSTPNSHKYELRTSGERVVFDGWRKVYAQYEKKEKEAPNIPLVEQQDPLDLVKLLPEQKFTQPPPRYNEASLIKILEELGIGRPSTYAPTISTIMQRQYVERNEGRAFVPTELGLLVNDFLVKHFSDVVNTHFTAEMEGKLDEIAKGSHKWQEVIGAFWKPFNEHLTTVKETVERVKPPEKKTGEKCPECNHDLVEKTGRYGAFIACSNFPECKFTKPVVHKIDVPCPKCQGDVIIKQTRKKRKFFGCFNYPKCDYASWTKPEK